MMLRILSTSSSSTPRPLDFSDTASVATTADSRPVTPVHPASTTQQSKLERKKRDMPVTGPASADTPLVYTKTKSAIKKERMVAQRELIRKEHEDLVAEKAKDVQAPIMGRTKKERKVEAKAAKKKVAAAAAAVAAEEAAEKVASTTSGILPAGPTMSASASSSTPVIPIVAAPVEVKKEEHSVQPTQSQVLKPQAVQTPQVQKPQKAQQPIQQTQVQQTQVHQPQPQIQQSQPQQQSQLQMQQTQAAQPQAQENIQPQAEPISTRTAAQLVREIVERDSVDFSDCAMFRPVVGLKWEQHVSADDVGRIRASLAAGGAADERGGAAAKPAQAGCVQLSLRGGGNFETRMLVTPQGSVLRALTEAEERRYVELETRRERERSWERWGRATPPPGLGDFVGVGPAGTLQLARGLHARADEDTPPGARQALDYLWNTVLPQLPCGRADEQVRGEVAAAGEAGGLAELERRLYAARKDSEAAEKRVEKLAKRNRKIVGLQ